MPPTVKAPDTLRGLLHPAAGPVLRAHLHHRTSGAKLATQVLIDTGASMSAVDKGLAAQLALPSTQYATWKAVTEVEGEHASPLRDGGVQLWGDRRIFPLRFIEMPGLADRLEGYTVGVLLGWDFLQTCKLVIDGPAGSFSLELPRNRRRRR